MKSYEISHIIA